ncbi:MAG: hypothetical protein L3J65_00875 [Robiginitomaculum sp.]|nr:hypothetical protein [Robiginitomaculum sp.]
MHKTQVSDALPAADIEFADFLKVDIRVGTVVDVREFPEARKPAYKIWVDFGGSIGIKKSSAQITEHYRLDELEHFFLIWNHFDGMRFVFWQGAARRAGLKPRSSVATLSKKQRSPKQHLSH